MSEQQSSLERFGCWVSAAGARIAGEPISQVAFILICVAWFIAGWNVNTLTAGLSILAITLTQMVLNSQGEREKEAHRRDVALHAKLDELLHASRRARDELAGIEELTEEQIVKLRQVTPPALPTGQDGKVAPQLRPDRAEVA